jgi:hypothetical protein
VDVVSTQVLVGLEAADALWGGFIGKEEGVDYQSELCG